MSKPIVRVQGTGRNRTSYMRAYRKRSGPHERILKSSRKYQLSRKGSLKRRKYMRQYVHDPEVRKHINAAVRARRKRRHEAIIPRPKRCMVCRKAKPLRFDHCHKTGRARGWLCDKCNTGIGKLGDNIAGLRRAIKYLEQVPHD